MTDNVVRGTFAQLFPPTLDDMIYELEREMQQRTKVYPRLICQGKLTDEKAQLQNARMRGALETLRWMREYNIPWAFQDQRWAYQEQHPKPEDTT